MCMCMCACLGWRIDSAMVLCQLVYVHVYVCMFRVAYDSVIALCQLVYVHVYVCMFHYFIF